MTKYECTATMYTWEKLKTLYVQRQAQLLRRMIYVLTVCADKYHEE